MTNVLDTYYLLLLLEWLFCLVILVRGVILMRLDHAGKIQSASLISATESEPEEVLDIAAQG
jgi:hypothetical protein